MISARTNELENCLKESVSPGKSVHGEIDFLLTSKYPLGNGEAASSLFDSATASHFQINGEDSPQVSISATDTHLERFVYCYLAILSFFKIFIVNWANYYWIAKIVYDETEPPKLLWHVLSIGRQ